MLKKYVFDEFSFCNPSWARQSELLELDNNTC